MHDLQKLKDYCKKKGITTPSIKVEAEPFYKNINGYDKDVIHRYCITMNVYDENSDTEIDIAEMIVFLLTPMDYTYPLYVVMDEESGDLELLYRMMFNTGKKRLHDKGIDYDKKSCFLVLDKIKVLPEYRRMGICSYLVENVFSLLDNALFGCTLITQNAFWLASPLEKDENGNPTIEQSVLIDMYSKIDGAVHIKNKDGDCLFAMPNPLI